MRALTGAAAAALLGLDGFANQQFSPTWCTPFHSKRADTLHVRSFGTTTQVGEVTVADPRVVLRHLAMEPLRQDHSDHELVELALEHALRLGWVTVTDFALQGCRDRGAAVLRDVLRARPDEPPTESYAETRGVQQFRALGIDPWRQVPVFYKGRIRYRADFVLPFLPSGDRPWVRRRPCPNRLTRFHGLIAEIDSRQWHEGSFERDHERQAFYDSLGLHWITLTPNQVERIQLLKATLAGAFLRAGKTLTFP